MTWNDRLWRLKVGATVLWSGVALGFNLWWLVRMFAYANETQEAAAYLLVAALLACGFTALVWAFGLGAIVLVTSILHRPDSPASDTASSVVPAPEAGAVPSTERET